MNIMEPFEQFVKKATKREFEALETSVNTAFMKDAQRAKIALEALLVSKEQGYVINRCDGDLVVNAREWLLKELGVKDEFWLTMERMIKTLTKFIGDDF